MLKTFASEIHPLKKYFKCTRKNTHAHTLNIGNSLPQCPFSTYVSD